MTRELRIIHLDREEMEHFARRILMGGARSLELALRLDVRGERTALLVHEGQIIACAMASRLSRAGDLRATYKICKISESPRGELGLAIVRVGLKSNQQSGLDAPGGDLTLGATQKVRDVIQSLDPVFSVALESLLDGRGRPINNAAQALRAEQADALSTFLHLASMTLGEEDAERFGGHADDVSILPQAEGTPREDGMIIHDAAVVPGWTRATGDYLTQAVFSDGYKRLTVTNINREKAESATGCDLIYFHQQRRSLVLVQYKRMVEEGGNWVYRIREDIIDQVEKMQHLDEGLAPLSTGWRLNPRGTLLKICKLTQWDLASTSMVPGMYIFSDQASMHIARSREGGPKTFSFENVEDYLTNTLFVDLVTYGLIGARGLSDSNVADAVNGALAMRRSVMVGHVDEPRLRRPSRSRQATYIRD